MEKSQTDRLDVIQLAQKGQTLKGHLSHDQVPRWAQSGVVDDSMQGVSWSAQFEWRTDATHVGEALDAVICAS